LSPNKDRSVPKFRNQEEGDRDRREGENVHETVVGGGFRAGKLGPVRPKTKKERKRGKKGKRRGQRRSIGSKRSTPRL